MRRRRFKRSRRSIPRATYKIRRGRRRRRSIRVRSVPIRKIGFRM